MAGGEMTMVPKDHLPILECSECRVACVIRLTINLTTGDKQYLWQRDCKHKRGEIMTREGATALSPFRSKSAGVDL